MIGGGRPLLPEILDQTDRVGAKSFACSANLHSARKQEFFRGGTVSMEESSRHTAKTEHWICAIQTTFKGISV